MLLQKTYRPVLLFAFKSFLLTLFLLFTQESFSATLLNVPTTDSILVARKGTKQFEYKFGTHLLISYNNSSSKISGQLYQVSTDSVGFMRNSKLNSITKVAIKDISSITILHKAGRKHWVIFLSVLLVLLVVGLMLSTNGLFVALPILAFPVVSLFTYIPFLFFNFLSDVFSKKSIRKGWSFGMATNKKKK